RRDLRPAPPGVRDGEPAHPAAVGHRLGGRGGRRWPHPGAGRRGRAGGPRGWARASRCGAEVIAVEHEWGQPVDAELVLAAHPSPKLIAAVHAQTSTGVLSDLGALAAGKGDALLLADCVTSLGGIPVRLDDWGVDLAYAGSQKCLGVAPGLAPFTINDRAWEHRIEKPQSWYLDLGMLGGYAGEGAGNGGRAYHPTAPTGMVVSLHAGLGRVLDEGLDAVHARHAEAGRLLH